MWMTWLWPRGGRSNNPVLSKRPWMVFILGFRITKWNSTQRNVKLCMYPTWGTHPPCQLSPLTRTSWKPVTLWKFWGSPSRVTCDGTVHHMLTSANRKPFALCHLKKFGVKDPELVSIYTGYVRPVLEYAAPVWHGCLATDQAKRLEKMQRRACNTIPGQRYSGYKDALCILSLCTLSERRCILDLPYKNFLSPTVELGCPREGRAHRSSDKELK